jgi:hypothetical protein
MQNTVRKKDLRQIQHPPPSLLCRCKSLSHILFLQIPSIIVAG